MPLELFQLYGYDWLYAVLVIALLAVVHLSMRECARRPPGDAEYLAQLAGRLECSEREIFLLAAREWGLSERRADEDFQHYVREAVLPHYMNDFIRAVRESESGAPGDADAAKRVGTGGGRFEDLDRLGSVNRPAGPPQWPSERELLKETGALLMVFAVVLMMSGIVVKYWDRPSVYALMEQRVARYYESKRPSAAPER